MREVSVAGQSVERGVVFNIQRFSIHDGPGIRTTVFLKGCVLRCRWCANPESISPRPELGVIRERCNKCGKCLKVCPEEAIAFSADGVLHIDRSRCTGCGECVAVCFPEALSIYGRQMSVDEVLKTVLQDEIFYRSSGGGVTISGGEPLEQYRFVIALFQACRRAGIHTCIETTGYCKSDILRQVLTYTDYVLYDIKHMDSEDHRCYTGRANDLVLTNAKIVAASGIPMLCRIPTVPGVNNSVENVRGTARFVKTLRDNIGLELLPYHRLGLGKYQALDLPYDMEGVKPPDTAHLEELKGAIEELGVQCLVSD